ncbi:hypothetical protein MBLNU230_g3624t1 [Neophaeotheca triangularis]
MIAEGTDMSASLAKTDHGAIATENVATQGVTETVTDEDMKGGKGIVLDRATGNTMAIAPALRHQSSFRGEPEAGGEKPPEKRKPNYKPTGLLAKEANTVAGTTTVLRYHEPPEGRKPPPKQQWRMYVFKKSEVVDTIYIHTRSCWLAGRDKTVTDLLLEHPSISKQHAVIQFRYQTTTNEFGDKTSKVKPYLIDLGSANGTKLNGNAIDASRYVELVDGDAIVFGESEREYVMMLPPP